MALSIYQKSIYSIIYNITMIGRSVGKSLKSSNSGKTYNDFKVTIFQELDLLTSKMDTGQLTENDIMSSIRNLSEIFKISFGQAQKAINVILKYHFHLTKNKDNKIKSVLNCPIDRVVLNDLLGIKKPLTKIDEALYIKTQNSIKQISKMRIDYDIVWDKQHLKKWGIL
jgi:CRISPR/Cas system-associated endonuclease Cas3-HD